MVVVTHGTLRYQDQGCDWVQGIILKSNEVVIEFKLQRNDGIWVYSF